MPDDRPYPSDKDFAAGRVADGPMRDARPTPSSPDQTDRGWLESCVPAARSSWQRSGDIARQAWSDNYRRYLKLVRRARRFSPLTRRVLAVNLLAIFLLLGGLLYLGEYRRSLIRTELDSLMVQAEVISGALGLGAVAVVGAQGDEELMATQTELLLRRMVVAIDTRARLFTDDGDLMVDSRDLIRESGMVDVEPLPEPNLVQRWSDALLDTYDRIVDWLPPRIQRMEYREPAVQTAGDYFEVAAALRGEPGTAVRTTSDRRRILSVAVPVQRYRQVVGALMLSRDDGTIEAGVRALRVNILRITGVALLVTVALSLYLAGTITRPVRILALAADRVRRGQGRQGSTRRLRKRRGIDEEDEAEDPKQSPLAIIPDFTDRGDEIGDLSASLREMTDALWKRMDAIERFAADVSHELKNPLSSMRSAIETLTLVKDEDRQKKLLAIIVDDIHRLDRLITDISDASRLDSELSRAASGQFDLCGLLSTLQDMYNAPGDGPQVRLLPADPSAGPSEGDGTEGSGLSETIIIDGVADRLVQVFQNLIGNAISFSPPDGHIDIAVVPDRDGRWVTVTVEDEGPGIPSQSLESIFERFYSERPQQEKFGTHSGLGLSISKQIVEAHGGTIRAENRHDGAGAEPRDTAEATASTGARFVIRLPIAEDAG